MSCLAMHCWTCSSRSENRWAFIETSSGFRHLQPVYSKLQRLWGQTFTDAQLPHKRTNRCGNQSFKIIIFHVHPYPSVGRFCCCFRMINYMQGKNSKCCHECPTNREVLTSSIGNWISLLGLGFENLFWNPKYTSSFLCIHTHSNKQPFKAHSIW